MSFIKSTALIILAGTIFLSCKKDSFITSSQARLTTSADTLSFDTVFTSAGSITQSFKIFNPNNQKLRLSKVKLAGGTSSPFKMNVDGTSTTEADNIEIEANDSIYVFVQVNVNPNTNNLPFILRDSILINYNGNNRFVQLQAYGQNAIFLKNTKITGNVTWASALPYVILGRVTIDSTASLIIPAGTKIYFHADAPMLVDGSLKVNGTRAAPITFTGDRLDPEYKDLPASWPGIYFRNTSKDNTIKFAIIKNAYQALVVQNPSINSNPKLKISQCIIDNAYDAGVLAINSSVQADNCLISNCGSDLFLVLGGNHQFTHCTVAAYGNFYVEHKNPVLQLANFITQNNQVVSANLNATFTNCIFWGEGGSVDNEVVVSKQGTTLFNVLFDHVLFKALLDPSNATLTATIKNQPPLFDSINITKRIFDFHLGPNSPAINKGITTSFTKDLDDRPRANGLPDLGCYEK